MMRPRSRLVDSIWGGGVGESGLAGDAVEGGIDLLDLQGAASGFLGVSAHPVTGAG